MAVLAGLGGAVLGTMMAGVWIIGGYLGTIARRLGEISEHLRRAGWPPR